VVRSRVWLGKVVKVVYLGVNRQMMGLQMVTTKVLKIFDVRVANGRPTVVRAVDESGAGLEG